MNRSPARASPGQNSEVTGSVSRSGQEDRLVVALQPDVEAQALVVGDADQGRASVAGCGEHRVGGAGGQGQVGAGQEPVEQAAGEDGDREERETAVDTAGGRVLNE